MSESAKKTASSIALQMFRCMEGEDPNIYWNALKDSLIEAGYPLEAENHYKCQNSIDCVVVRAIASGDWPRMDAWEYGASLR